MLGFHKGLFPVTLQLLTMTVSSANFHPVHSVGKNEATLVVEGSGNKLRERNNDGLVTEVPGFCIVVGPLLASFTLAEDLALYASQVTPG